jgi:hypothetical protein
MKRLLDEIKEFKGNTLLLGVDDNKIITNLKKNKKISLYEIEIFTKRKLFSKDKAKENETGKKVNIKKFRKIFKRKSIDNIIINLDNMYDYYKYMASNSIYVCNNKIYIYGNKELVTTSSIVKKFKRYNTKIEVITKDNDYLVIIDSSKAKYNLFKDKFYIVIDTFINLGDMISYFLTS